MWCNNSTVFGSYKVYAPTPTRHKALYRVDQLYLGCATSYHSLLFLNHTQIFHFINLNATQICQ